MPDAGGLPVGVVYANAYAGIRTGFDEVGRPLASSSQTATILGLPPIGV